MKVACLLAGVLVATAVSIDAYEAQGFIKVCNGKFADARGKSWVFAGWNGYTLLLQQAHDYLYNKGSDLVTARFKEAKASGLTAVRIWGHGGGTLDAGLVLQTNQGVYDEKVFRSLDYVISVAKKYNVRVLVSLTTFWQDNDGILAYARWAGLTKPATAANKKDPNFDQQWDAKDAFWQSDKARGYFKQHMLKMFNRKNTFSGLAYKDDSTIFGWNLMNEPRCPASQNGSACTDRVTGWGNVMYAYAHQNNQKQLFAYGEEGFFATNPSCNPDGNLGRANWAATLGQDFSPQNANGDFAEFHYWPTTWKTPSLSFAPTWLECHLKVCTALKKPCVLGEFGRSIDGSVNERVIASERNPYLSIVYSTIEKFIAQGSAFGGDLFWKWVPNGQRNNDPDAILSTDSTFTKIIAPHAKKLNAASGKAIC